MQMVGYDYVSIDYQFFIGLVEFYVIQEYFGVDGLSEQVDLIDNGEG